MKNPARSFLTIVLLLLGKLPLSADLSVGWISREPRIPYVWASTNPTREGWPAEGQDVTWTAHVWNLTGGTLGNIGYRWTIDGETVAEGATTLPPGGPAEVTLPWSWTFVRHEIAFEIDTADRVAEIEERNNRLLIYSDALAVGFWVERSFWDQIRPTLVAGRFGAATFDDWMQIRIRQYNGMAALARYPETPHGVLDRWRIDAIHIVEDGALPVVPPGSDVRDWEGGEASWPVLYPDSSDRTIDMQWGFPKTSLIAYVGKEPWPLLYDSLIHELAHARTMIDVYGWNLDRTYDRIEITPGPVADAYGNFFRTTEYGLMNTQWGFIDRYSAIAFNRIAGYRAREGTYNEPWDLGRFLNDLPTQNRVKLVTPDGATFPGHTVRVYSSSSRLDPDFRSHSYETFIDNIPKLVLTADDEGAILVGRNPFSDANLTMWVDRTNTTAIIEVAEGDRASPFCLRFVRGAQVGCHPVLPEL